MIHSMKSTSIQVTCGWAGLPRTARAAMFNSEGTNMMCQKTFESLTKVRILTKVSILIKEHHTSNSALRLQMINQWWIKTTTKFKQVIEVINYNSAGLTKELITKAQILVHRAS